MNKKFRCLFLLISLLFFHVTKSDIIGSLTGVLKSGFFNFPENPLIFANEIRGFTWMANGFSLANSDTECDFNSLFPVSGNINLNGGTLTLENHLRFADDADWQTVGTIVGAGFICDLGSAVTYLGGANSGSFQDLSVQFSNALEIDTDITFLGDSSIVGNGNILTLGSSGEIIVGSSATLTLKDIIVKGVSDYNIRCAADSSTLVFDNVTWYQDDTYYFTTGSLEINNKVKMSGSGTFAFQTDQVSTVSIASSLKLDNGFTFSYDPILIDSKELFEFVDETSELILNNATLHTTTTGFHLTKGTLGVKGMSFISSETSSFFDAQGDSIFLDEGIILGDNLNATNDMLTDITISSELTLLQGSLHYKNVSSTGWKMRNAFSKLVIGTAAILKIIRNISTDAGFIEFNDKAVLARADNKKINGVIKTNGKLLYSRLI